MKVYQGNDRVKQVDWLRNIAEDIVAHSGVQVASQAEEAVDFWLDPSGDCPPPDWFNSYDRQLLTDLVRYRLH